MEGCLTKRCCMPDYEAEVEPDQPWDEDGTAGVTPKPPFSSTGTFSLPLEHRDGGPVTVLKISYPEGLIIIPNDNAPRGESASNPHAEAPRDRDLRSA